MREKLDDSDKPNKRMRSDDKAKLSRMLKEYGRHLDKQKTDTFEAKNLLTNVKAEIERAYER